MGVPMETGALPIGVMYEGRRCREFALRPLKARDSMEVRRGADAERALSDDELMGLSLLGKRLTIEGIPSEAMTLERMEDLWDEDLAEIMAAEGRLQDALARFRREDAAAADTGAAQGGNSVGSSHVDAGEGGTAVGGGLGGAQHPAGAEGEREDLPGEEAAESP